MIKDEVRPPIEAAGLWIFSHRYFIVLATDGKAYKMTTHRPTRLTPLEQRLDLGWKPEELAAAAKKYATQIQPIQSPRQEQRREYLKTFRKALPPSQHGMTMDDSEYVKAFTDIAKKLDVPPREALGRIRKDIENEKAFVEFSKTEEFRQFEDNASFWMDRLEDEHLLKTAFTEIARRLRITQDEALKRMTEGVDKTIEG